MFTLVATCLNLLFAKTAAERRRQYRNRFRLVAHVPVGWERSQKEVELGEFEIEFGRACEQ